MLAVRGTVSAILLLVLAAFSVLAQRRRWVRVIAWLLRLVAATASHARRLIVHCLVSSFHLAIGNVVVS